MQVFQRQKKVINFIEKNSNILLYHGKSNKVIFPNANLVNLNYLNDDVRFYLAILNSNLIGYYYNVYYGESNTNITKLAFESIPIPDIESIDKKPFSEGAQELIDLNVEFQSYSQRFILLLKSKHNIIKVSKKIQSWYNLDFSEFLKELDLSIKKSANFRIFRL